MPMPMPGMDTVVFTATVSQPMVDTAMLDTATARGLLTLRLTPGMDMEDSMVTDSQPMVATDTEVLATDTERGPLRPSQRLMPGSDMVDFTATVLAWAMAMEVLATDTERGPLRPSLRPMPGTEVLALAMAAMATEVLATDTERGPLRPSLRPMPGTDMVAYTATDSPPMAVTAT